MSELKNKILDLYHKGYSINEISEEIDKSYQMIYRYIKLAGFNPTKNNKKRKVIKRTKKEKTKQKQKQKRELKMVVKKIGRVTDVYLFPENEAQKYIPIEEYFKKIKK